MSRPLSGRGEHPGPGKAHFGAHRIVSSPRGCIRGSPHGTRFGYPPRYRSPPASDGRSSLLHHQVCDGQNPEGIEHPEPRDRNLGPTPGVSGNADKRCSGILNFFEGVIKRGGVSQRQGEEES